MSEAPIKLPPMTSQTAHWDGEQWVYGTMYYGPGPGDRQDKGRVVEASADCMPDYEAENQEEDTRLFSARERRQDGS